MNEPKGVQKPHVPLMIAGGGEKVTLRLVAQYADVCNIMDSPAELKRKYAALERHCEHVGREYNNIWRTATLQALTWRAEGRRAEPFPEPI